MKPTTHARPYLLALLLAVALVPLSLASAQKPDPAKHVEAMALRAHLQNLRTGSFTLWIGGNLGSPGAAAARTPVGDVLDRYELPRFSGEGSVRAEDLRRPTAFNFWASWCPPCRIEFPHLTEVALAPEDHAFDVLFINTADTEADARAFLATQPDGITAVLDRQDWLARRVRAATLPTTLLVDRDGTVLAAHVGVVTPTISDFFDAVAANPGAGMFNPADWPDALLTVELAPFEAADAAPLALNQRTLGTLTEAAFQRVYAFEGQAGQVVTAQMSADSRTLDPYVVLIGPDGERIAEGGDTNASRDAELTVTLPEGGTYLVVATRFLGAEGFSGGDYSLTVSTPNAGGAAQGIMRYGDRVMGRVSGLNPRELYAFTGRAGDVITLRLTHTPSVIGLQIEVQGPDRHRLAESEPAEGGEAALEALALPADGDYRVIVKRPRAHDATNLDYTLTLDRAE